MRRDLLVLLAQLLNLLPYRVERARCIVASGCEPLIAAHERREPLLELVEGERRSLLRVLLLLLLETLPLRHQLLETSALDLDRALGARELLGALLPAFAQPLHRALGVLELLLVACHMRLDLGDLPIGAL